MRQLFISYARKNRPDVDDLVRDLDALGWQTWVDSSLRGGQAWWEEILRRIAECDVFLVIVSRHTLSSVACKRELQWALELNKPVLPVAVERRPDALPRSLSMRQIVDYFQPGKKAAFALAGGLTTLPPAPPLPEQLPEPPPAPLSYLSDLIDQVSQPDPLTHEQQHQILSQLQRALRSPDPEERGGGRYVLETFSNRHDLYADVDRTLAQLGLAEHDTQPPGVAAEGQDQRAPTQHRPAVPVANPPSQTSIPRPHPVAAQLLDHTSTSTKAPSGRRRRLILVGALLAAFAAIIVTVAAVVFFVRPDPGPDPSVPSSSAPTGISGSATAPSSDALPSGYVGTWQGIASDEQGLSFDILLALRDGRVGQEVGTLSQTAKFLSGQRCESQVLLKSVSSTGITFQERLSGGGSQCVDTGATTTLQIVPDGSLRFSMSGIGLGDITGTLRRQ